MIDTQRLIPRGWHAVAITTPANSRSWGLIEDLCTHRAADGDFMAPAVQEDSALRKHITYRIDRPQ